MHTHTRKPSLIVINQTVNQDLIDWLSEFAEQVGPIELWTGSTPEQPPPPTQVRLRNLPAYDRSSHFTRFITWSRFTIAALFLLLSERGGTPILAATNPPFVPLITWLICVLQKRPYALLEWDIYPQVLASMKVITRDHVLYKLWYYWHRSALRNARSVITIGDHMATYLQKMAGNPQVAIEVIPTWVDTNKIQPLDRRQNPFIQEQELHDKFVVLYSGNIGATHSIETVVEVAKLLQAFNKIQFIIIGDGIKRKVVEAAIENGQKNIRLLPWQPTEYFPYVLASADIGIVTLGEEYGGLSMPSKSYALLAAGVPILAITRPPNDLAALVEKFHCGINYTPDAAPLIADWIRSVLEEPHVLEEYRRWARKTAIQYFDTDICKAQLSAAIHSSLLNSNGNYHQV